MAPAVRYVLLVFGAGFLLGAVRVPFFVPRLGERYAELLEMPVMFLAIRLAARHVVRRFSLSSDARLRLTIGLGAWAMLLIAEWLLAVALQGGSVRDYIASRDPVSGSVYLAMLGVFAVGMLPKDQRATLSWSGTLKGFAQAART